MRPLLVRMEEVEREAIYRAVVECVLYPLGSLAAANETRRRSATRCTLCSGIQAQLQRERSTKSSSTSASSTPRRHASNAAAIGAPLNANANAVNGSSAAVRLIGNALSLATPTLLARNRDHRPLAARSSDSMRSNKSSAGLSVIGDDLSSCVCPPDPTPTDLLEFAQQVRKYALPLPSIVDHNMTFIRFQCQLNVYYYYRFQIYEVDDMTRDRFFERLRSSRLEVRDSVILANFPRKTPNFKNN